MSKPQWLIDKEMGAKRLSYDPDLCCECIYYGQVIKYTRHKGREIVDVHECDIHPKCLNTKYSICCKDFTREQLV